MKAFDTILLNLFVDVRFDGGQLLALLWSDEGDGHAIGAHAAGAADAVHVVLRIVRQVVVDDVRDVGHVDAPAHHIRGDQVGDLAFAKSLHETR